MAYIGKSPSQGVRNRFQYQATAGQTSFSGSDANGLTLTYTDSLYMDVYQNGILLVPGDDYTATTGITVVLVQGASVNDIVEMVVYDVFSVPDAVSQSAGGTFSGNVTMGNNLTVSGASTFNGNVELSATSPVLTVTATDTNQGSILFKEGSTSKFNLSVVGSSDVFQIYNFNTSSQSMVIDANGHVTMPSQPAFLAHVASDITSLNVNGSSNTVIVFGTERFDQNGDYNNSTGIFTAPVTGRYQLQYSLRIENADTAANTYDFNILTSNKNYNHRFDPDFADSDFGITINLSLLVDMDADDTAKVDYYQHNGSSQTSIDVQSYFSGFLVC